MSCKDCIYYEVCPLGLAANGETGTCLKFKNKADFVEVVRCQNCKYRLPIDESRYKYKGTSAMHCFIHAKPCHEDDFCSYGRMKEK